MATCRMCAAEVLWVTTSEGKRMPLDPPENDAGNVAVNRWTARVLRAGQRPLPNETLHVPHFATCPKWKAGK
jgi:hypothetical protein